MDSVRCFPCTVQKHASSEKQNVTCAKRNSFFFFSHRGKKWNQASFARHSSRKDPEQKTQTTKKAPHTIESVKCPTPGNVKSTQSCSICGQPSAALNQQFICCSAGTPGVLFILPVQYTSVIEAIVSSASHNNAASLMYLTASTMRQVSATLSSVSHSKTASVILDSIKQKKDSDNEERLDHSFS